MICVLRLASVVYLVSGLCTAAQATLDGRESTTTLLDNIPKPKLGDTVDKAADTTEQIHRPVPVIRVALLLPYGPYWKFSREKVEPAIDRAVDQINSREKVELARDRTVDEINSLVTSTDYEGHSRPTKVDHGDVFDHQGSLKGSNSSDPQTPLPRTRYSQLLRTRYPFTLHVQYADSRCDISEAINQVCAEQ